MKNYSPFRARAVLILVLLLYGRSGAYTQSVLDRTLSVEFRQQRLDQVLQILSNKGDFYFSYNSAILKRDSVVSLSVRDKTIRQILDLLFRGNFEYKESGNYIILRRTPAKQSQGTGPPGWDDKRYVVNGVILDEETGEKINQASVYDKQGLIATLTNENGVFTIRLKNRSGPVALTVSKEFYDDTTVLLSPGLNQRMSVFISPAEFTRRLVTISPNDYPQADSIRVELQSGPGIARVTYLKKEPIQVEITSFGKFLLSSRLKIQSINLKKFFAERSFQVSLVPGVGTNGLLSPQIVNKWSLNIFSGYTAGLKGLELGGLLNIDKKDVQGVQVAGLFNTVGGTVRGWQIAGLHNTGLDSLKGWQLAGISNFNNKKLTGLQAAGVYNHLADSLRGAQVAGLVNYARKNVSGVQIAGLVNTAARETHGVQIAGLVNYTRHLKGVQVGLINIADTSEGYSIGLINIVRKGYHGFSFFANEISPLNFAFRSGNAKLYSIFLAGLNADNNNRSYYYGFGLGHEFSFGRSLSLNPELSTEHIAGGVWNNFKHAAYLNKLSLDLHWRLGKYVSLSAGPSLTIYCSDKTYLVNGHAFTPLHDGYPSFKISDKVKGWFGWQASINFR